MLSAPGHADFLSLHFRAVVDDNARAFPGVFRSFKDHVACPPASSQSLQTFLQGAGANQARLRVISQHRLDRIEDGVTDAFAESYQTGAVVLHEFHRNTLERLT